MDVRGAQACGECGRVPRAGELVCGLCGSVLGRPPAAVGGASDGAARTSPDAFLHRRRELSRGERWRALAAGPWGVLALGAALSLTPYLFGLVGRMGWFLSALVHEMGHAGAAWLFGMPAVPAIRLDGHAAAVHGAQLVWLVALLAAAFLSVSRRFRSRRLRIGAAATALVLYPALALGPLADPVHLVAGHGAEILFAGLCLVRAIRGGFSSSRAEPVLYAALGTSLLADHAGLCLGLLWSEEARALYATNGSFGLVNDYLRLSRASGAPLPAIAAAMGAATLVVPSVVIGWYVRTGVLGGGASGGEPVCDGAGDSGRLSSVG